MELIAKPGYDYKFDPAACARCPGNCCNGASGNVFLNDNEIRDIAAFLGVTATELAAGRLERRAGRMAAREIREGDNHACVFFDTRANNCSIYPVRPSQCRSFPFWEYYRLRHGELAMECPGAVFPQNT